MRRRFTGGKRIRCACVTSDKSVVCRGRGSSAMRLATTTNTASRWHQSQGSFQKDENTAEALACVAVV
eukprot:6187526-Pleurochrysis_carterae.AAC.2